MSIRRGSNFEIIGGNIAGSDFTNWERTLKETGFADEEINLILFAASKEDLHRQIERSGLYVPETIISRIWTDINNFDYDDEEGNEDEEDKE